ncbi:hypothetical protein LUZ60_014451 [Juncus effusus]|nr:hypothetical protein LUZ60_014451 [Juncus effusus]
MSRIDWLLVLAFRTIQFFEVFVHTQTLTPYKLKQPSSLNSNPNRASNSSTLVDHNNNTLLLMASKSVLFLAVNLLFFVIANASCPPPPPPKPKPKPSCPPPPTPSGAKCPADALKLGVCANVLNLIKAKIGAPPTTECCSLLGGLVDLEAAVCLCTAIKANILGINLNLPIDLSLVLNYCGKGTPSGFQCA